RDFRYFSTSPEEYIHLKLFVIEHHLDFYHFWWSSKQSTGNLLSSLSPYLHIISSKLALEFSIFSHVQVPCSSHYHVCMSDIYYRGRKSLLLREW
ncbi:hypothetical protein PRIPAC_79931, partial [Pristionchus pacificus]